MANIFILHGDDINGIDEAAAKLVQEQKDSGFLIANIVFWIVGIAILSVLLYVILFV